ncbi:MAG: AI-2E family transporter [Granulicella sp.]
MLSIPEESRWSQITLYLLTAAILILCALILQPLFSAIVGAVVLAVALQRPYDWLAARITNRNLCATLALVIVILAIIVPCFFLAQEIIQQAIHTVNAIRHDAYHAKSLDFIADHPALAERIQSFTDSIDPDDTIKAAAAFLGGRLLWLLGHSIVVITQLVFMLFILFFLFRDREIALSFARSILPLRDDEATEVLDRVDGTIKATALGRLTIAAIQGILAGIAYWVLGVPGVILWAFTTSAFAMIPGVGAVLIWSPIALYLGLTGHWGKAVLLAVWGGGVVSLIDNILYPILVGASIRAHTVTVLLSILGGVALFGISGIVVGPVAFTIAATLLDIWRVRTHHPTIET